MSEAPLRDRVGKYPVMKLLGTGATSEVFLCHDPFNERDVAVKVVSTDAFDDPARGKLFKKLFVNEASLAGKLQHPHIVQIYDAVAEDRLNYIVMEYVDGGTLEKFCASDSLLPIERVVEMAFKCTRALEFAHSDPNPRTGWNRFTKLLARKRHPRSVRWIFSFRRPPRREMWPLNW